MELKIDVNRNAAALTETERYVTTAKIGEQIGSLVSGAELVRTFENSAWIIFPELSDSDVAFVENRLESDDTIAKYKWQ